MHGVKSSEPDELIRSIVKQSLVIKKEILGRGNYIIIIVVVIVIVIVVVKLSWLRLGVLISLNSSHSIEAIIRPIVCQFKKGFRFNRGQLLVISTASCSRCCSQFNRMMGHIW